MPLEYILRRTSQQLGMDYTKTGDRQALLDMINSAAEQVYRITDLVGSLMEQTFQIGGDQQLSFPYDVALIRGIREYATWRVWTINDMRPRYSNGNWKNSWKHIRIKGARPTAIDSLNCGTLTYNVDGIESGIYGPMVINVTGSARGRTKVIETITFDDPSNLSIVGNVMFTNIDSITKSFAGSYDITVTNTSDQQLAVIPNTTLQSRYTIVDVSNYPFSQIPTDNCWQYMEVLYKRALNKFEENTDSFPCDGYDDILVDKILQLRAEQTGNAEEASLRDQKVTREIARKDFEASGGQQQVISFIPNNMDTIIRKNPAMNFRRTPFRR